MNQCLEKIQLSAEVLSKGEFFRFLNIINLLSATTLMPRLVPYLPKIPILQVQRHPFRLDTAKLALEGKTD